MASFPERFRELRREQKWTLDDMSEMLSTTKSTLSRYENGHREPKIEFVEQAAEIFEVSTDYLIGTSDIRQSCEDLQKDKLTILFRKADKLGEEERKEVLDHFENTIDLYLKIKG